MDPEEFLRKAMNLSAFHSPTNHKSRAIRLVLMKIIIEMVTMVEKLEISLFLRDDLSFV